MRMVAIALAALTAAGAAAAARPSSARYAATLTIRLESTWRITTTTSGDPCPIRDQWDGRRVVTLRTAVPTPLRVSRRAGQNFTVRALAGTGLQGGSVERSRPEPGGLCEASIADCFFSRGSVAGGTARLTFVGSGRVRLDRLRYTETPERPRGCAPEVASFEPDPPTDVDDGRVRQGGFRSLARRIVVHGELGRTTDASGPSSSSSRSDRVEWTLVLRRR